MNPITVQMLRDDWIDDPNLTDEQRARLAGIDDAALEAALDEAFQPNEDMWLHLLDSTRADATDRLVRTLG